MSSIHSFLITGMLVAFLPAMAMAQNRPSQSRFGGPIVLGPDDVQRYPDPPDSIVANRPEVPHGKLEMISYDPNSVGTTFQSGRGRPTMTYRKISLLLLILPG